MRIELDTHEVVDLAEHWRQTPELVRRELTRSAWESTLFLEREVKELTPVGATGTLRASIGARAPEQLADSVIGVVGTSNPHAVPVELGTRPHFPPLEPLKDWVRAKLDIRDGDQVEGVALAIARKIAARGTLGVGMFHRTIARHRGTVEAMHRRGVQRIAEGLAQ